MVSTKTCTVMKLWLRISGAASVSNSLLPLSARGAGSMVSGIADVTRMIGSASVLCIEMVLGDGGGPFQDDFRVRKVRRNSRIRKHGFLPQRLIKMRNRHAMIAPHVEARAAVGDGAHE